MKGKVRYLVPAACILLGAFLAIYTVANYQLTLPAQGVGPGFLPLILSVLLAIVGIIDLVKCRKRAEPAMSAQNWLVVVAVAAVLALSYVIGMVVSVMLFAFLWLKVKEKCSWPVTLISMAVIALLVIGIFVLWMDIPFPKGILFESIFG